MNCSVQDKHVCNCDTKIHYKIESLSNNCNNTLGSMLGFFLKKVSDSSFVLAIIPNSSKLHRSNYLYFSKSMSGFRQSAY